MILKLLFFFLLGSLISFFADNVGKRIGKRKIVLFGIRPRYTAIIITSFAGGLIAIGSIIFLSFLSTDARIYLFQMKQIKQQIDLYKKEVKILQDKYTELTRDLSILIQTTHLGDILFLKDQPIYIFSFYNDGSEENIYNAITEVKKLVVNRYSYKLGMKKEIYLPNVVRIDDYAISNLRNEIYRKRNKRIALIFVSKRNTFIGEYVDLGIYSIDDRVIVPANTILYQVDIHNPFDVELNFALIMQGISKIQEDLVARGKIFLPQEKSIGGEIPFGKIISELIKIKESSYLTKNQKKFKILLINQDDIYVAGKFEIMLKTIEE